MESKKLRMSEKPDIVAESDEFNSEDVPLRGGAVAFLLLTIRFPKSGS